MVPLIHGGGAVNYSAPLLEALREGSSSIRNITAPFMRPLKCATIRNITVPLIQGGGGNYSAPLLGALWERGPLY